jgi:pimeloyl-ACP methyl ester carboxylesterase
LEPFQTAASLDGQVQELRDVLEEHGNLPIRLVGWSWGAMLSFVVAARHPHLVKKLILVSSAVFEEAYAARIMPTRLSRLSQEDRRAADSLTRVLDDPAVPTSDKNMALARLAGLFTKADACDPLTLDMEVVEVQHDINRRVWNEARRLRMSEELLELGRRIGCPVVVIHGDYDPHPAEGVRKPLSSVLRNFRFILLKDCGHIPWIERRAKEEFFQMLERELA